LRLALTLPMNCFPPLCIRNRPLRKAYGVFVIPDLSLNRRMLPTAMPSKVGSSKDTRSPSCLKHPKPARANDPFPAKVQHPAKSDGATLGALASVAVTLEVLSLTEYSGDGAGTELGVTPACDVSSSEVALCLTVTLTEASSTFESESLNS